VAGRRIQTTGLTLLGHFGLLFRPKPAVSRGKVPGVNLAPEKKNKLLNSSCCVARIDESLYGAGNGN
jgi:hypothetical protein